MIALADTTAGRIGPMLDPIAEPADQDLSILSVDPGTEHSGWVFTHEWDVLRIGNETPNDVVVDVIRSLPWDYLLIEEIVTAFGRNNGRAPVGKEVFRAQLWAGILFTHGLQVCSRRDSVRLLPRGDIARHFKPPGRKLADDSLIRKKLIARYPKTGDGKEPAIGTGKQPGPLYGMAGHAWQALGLTAYFLEHFHDRISPTGQ
jgi:hypothetical protein